MSKDIPRGRSKVREGFVHYQRISLTRCSFSSAKYRKNGIAYYDSTGCTGTMDFHFDIQPAISSQHEEALTELALNQLYRLRPGHPAIDAVCIAEQTKGSKKDAKYLLLI